MTMASIPQYGAATTGIAKDALESDGTGITPMNHMAIRAKGEIHYGTLSLVFWQDPYYALC